VIFEWVFSENLPRKFKFHYNLTRITRNLHEDQNTFLIISRSVLLRIRNISDKFVEEIKRHFLHNLLLNSKFTIVLYTEGADKSLARTGMKQATATEDFEFHISFL
jgi:hypothetical protein